MALVRGYNWMINRWMEGYSGPAVRNANDKKRELIRNAEAHWAANGQPAQTINDKIRTFLRWTWATNEPVVPGQRPIAATPGQPGQWLPYSSEPPDSGDLDGITPIPASAWPPGTWIVTSDGALVRWNGSGWSVATPSLLYQTLVLSQNPIGYWRLNEASGLVAADASINANAGTYLNAPVLDVPAIAGSTGMGKTGVIEQGVQIPQIAPYRTALCEQVAFTVECWFRATTVPTGADLLIGWFNELTGVTPVQLGVGDDGRLAFVCSDNIGGVVWTVGVGPAQELCDGVWHMLTITVDAAAATAEAFIDGVSEFSEGGFTLAAMPPPPADLYIGTVQPGLGEAPGTPFEVDEVVFYAGVQAAADIAARYALGAPAAPPVSNYETVILADNPFGYWRLDDVSGSVAVNLGSSGVAGAYAFGGGSGDVALWVPRTPPAVASGQAVTLVPAAASFVEIPPGTFGALDFTYEMWFRWSAAVPSASSAFLANALGPSQINLQIYWNPGGTLTAHRWPPGGSLVTLTAPATAQDVWHHVVYRRITGVSVSLWVDGVQVATTADPAGMPPANAITIGGDVTGTNFAHGMIDEVAIYQHALTGPQIAAHYAARL